MDFFEMTIISSILTIFPILLYFIYLIYNYDFNKNANELILDLCLITSFYLTYKVEMANVSYFLIFIPLLIAYLKKRDISILVIFALTVSCNNIYFIIAEVIYYLLSKIIKNKKIYIIYYLVINSFMTILIISNSYYLSEFNFLKIVIQAVVGLSITIFILRLFDKIDKLLNIYMNLNEIKKESKIQESLFKITHEIKNPIAVCKGYLDMYDVNNIEHSKKYVPIIKSEINRTLFLLQDFLSLRKIKLEKEELDLSILFDEVIEEMSLYKNQKVKYVKQYDDEIYIEGDYNRLKQVILNILKNSNEAILDEGVIIIQVLEKDSIIVKIKDNGIGMTKEVLEKIKEPFYTTKRNGTGLGVPLTVEILEAHGFKIDYDSTLNEGTTVIIEIPKQEKK